MPLRWLIDGVKDETQACRGASLQPESALLYIWWTFRTTM